ncbi:unnamed protein product [Adineta ricciae]|uniref:Uncharacterized protein n=1 Tax=Adineta ricciae TaxID=249248 RepID=A0A815RC11_ADIRI|nr:unnamed protein product [Adineta ricciae]
MPNPTDFGFRQVFPRWLPIVIGVIEVVCVAVMFITELGNVGSNFWVTNVFAGGWCGCVLIIHFLSLFIVGCCAPSPTIGLVVLIISVVALVACIALISFDAVFIALPSTCILTSSCSSYASSTSMFSYYFRNSFFTTFRQLSPFTNYTESQAKFLFQIVQLSVGALCGILCVVYIIVYIISRSKASRIAPASYQNNNYPAPQPNYAQRQSVYNGNQPRPTAPQTARNPQGDTH